MTSNIYIEHVYPPIPIRSMDWSANWDDMDCDWDSERGFFSDHPQGTGGTPEEAIADLIYSTFDTIFDDGRIEAHGLVLGDGLGGYNA